MQEYQFQLLALKWVVDILEQQGLDRHRLLAAADISPSLLRQTSGLISQLKVAKLMTAADRASQQPLASARCGLSMPLRKQGVLAIAVQSMPNLEAMIQMLKAFLNAQSSGTDLDLVKEGDLVRAEFSLRFADQLSCDSMHRAMLCNLFKTFQTLFGESWRATEVWLMHSFSHTKELSQLLNCPVKDNKAINAIVFEQRWAHVTGAQVYPAEALRKQSSETLQRLEDLDDLIYQILPPLIYDGNTSIEHVAELFGVHVRVLQKRLKAKGTSYSTLLEDARKTMAVDLLVDSQLSIADISLQLGFKEPAIFIRSFKKWFKQTPLQWRKSAQGY
ncbi:helix-turn-helix domain-containing protein [Agarivorans sp. B2Z047]|uniref:AraC family transcriptional regulator n=1 Tax=Agarivorans sp. B2Z047 TaxID=2652721 RepID=UPI00128DBB00|nr:AraC family transcriptional regulator [Agarivorans sp. B2Z047]MPW27534.1 helix-turn-helix domain-containing protein [Agarivorans sp. B2Z047]UQN44625.1 AraC family transcriptional regulator [Agarivorans sp. B2Z047]